jgi:hypothetical protein
MGLRGETATIAAVCCSAVGMLLGWLLGRRQSRKEEILCHEPPQSNTVDSTVYGQFSVFISHAGAQKHFALWVRSHVRICGYRAFVDERDLKQASARRIPISPL